MRFSKMLTGMEQPSYEKRLDNWVSLVERAKRCILVVWLKFFLLAVMPMTSGCRFMARGSRFESILFVPRALLKTGTCYLIRWWR